MTLPGFPPTSYKETGSFRLRRGLAQGLLSAILTLTVAGPAAAKVATRSTYIRHAQEQIDDLAAKLRRLERSKHRMNRETRERFENALRALWRKEKIARVQLERIKRSTEAAWRTLRLTEDRTLIALAKSYRYVANHYPSS